MEHAKHIIRAVLLLAVAGVVFVLVRHFAIPESYGMHGAYRFDSVAEHSAKPPHHGAPGACAECHDEQGDALSEGPHTSVSCEVCHAPLSDHIRDGEMIAEMPVERSVELCARCHQQLTARPASFPQIVPHEHVAENNAKMSEAVCLECHNAHNPTE